jgi:AcrR family transcriptional regulator
MATGLNVASLYHYFPSKRDLLVAVLEERGFVDDPVATSQPSISRQPVSGLADLLDEILQSMLEVEDFVRLMLGEVMRGDDTAYAVGSELFAATQASLEHWLGEQHPTLCAPGDQAAMARRHLRVPRRRGRRAVGGAGARLTARTRHGQRVGTVSR